MKNFIEKRIRFECTCSYKTDFLFSGDKKLSNRIKCNYCGKIYGFYLKDDLYEIFELPMLNNFENLDYFVV